MPDFAGTNDGWTPRASAFFAAAFALTGLTLGYFTAYPAIREQIASRSWVGVPCEIVSSRVNEFIPRDGKGGTSYSVNVRFRYQYNGRKYYGYRYQLAPLSRSGSGAASDIQEKLATVPAGLKTTCWLDPGRPDNAVLNRNFTSGTAVTIGLPLAFLLVGVIGLVVMWRQRTGAAAERAERVEAVAPVAAGGRRLTPTAVLFFAGFALVGLGIGYFAAYPAIREYLSARHWEGVPCKIVSSRVTSETKTESRDEGGTETRTYHDIEVTFAYEYRQRPYTGRRYQLSQLSISGDGVGESMEAKVAAIPAGSTTTCYVDPAHPQTSVINRGFTLGAVVRIALSLLFLLVGVGGMIGVARGWIVETR